MSRIAYREDEKENLRRIIAQIYKLDYKNLLSYWATQEVKKAEMYQLLYHLAKKINWDERIAGLFREMYIDSVTQAEKLISVFKKQFPEEKMEYSEISSLEVELSEERLKDAVFSGRFREVLGTLIEIERLAEEIYGHLTEKTEDKEAKNVFSWLYKISSEHYNLLGGRLYEEIFDKTNSDDING